MLKAIKFFLAIHFNLDFLYKNDSYSQEGEDLIVAKLLNGVTKGLYVDVGAYHPFKLSNTYLLYKQGLRGINIDPSPTSKKLFEKARPADTFINTAISNKSRTLNYYIFESEPLNTLSEKQAKTIRKSKQSKLVRTLKIKTQKLSDILEKHANNKIDFLNIDVEGLELEVLNSLNLKKFKPKIIAVENLGSKIEVEKMLIKHKYNKVAQTNLTGIYVFDP